MDKSFEALGLSQNVLDSVADMGFAEPTPVQEQSIPLVLDRRDVCAAAQTGTGKTAAFALPIMDLLHRDKEAGTLTGKGPFALIVTPTRELAQQIDATALVVGEHTGLSVLTVVGGTKYEPQTSALSRGVDVLVATPGRLLDLMERKAVTLSSVGFLVLDEADRMLDMGFWPSVRRIVKAVPEERQTMLFSATLDKSVMDSVSSLLRDPDFVEIEHEEMTADTVDEYIMPVDRAQKPALLAALLEEMGHARVLVFTRTKHGADNSMKRLVKGGFRAGAIHADRTQGQRERALNGFKDGDIDVLVATDVLARGIDINQVDYVVNYDVPATPEDYVHRIGRTGRAGLAGTAITFVGPDEISQLRDIEFFKKEIIPTFDIEGFDYRDDRIVPSPTRSAERVRQSRGHCVRQTPKAKQAEGADALQVDPLAATRGTEVRKYSEEELDAIREKKAADRAASKKGRDKKKNAKKHGDRPADKKRGDQNRTDRDGEKRSRSNGGSSADGAERAADARSNGTSSKKHGGHGNGAEHEASGNKGNAARGRSNDTGKRSGTKDDAKKNHRPKKSKAASEALRLYESEMVTTKDGKKKRHPGDKSSGLHRGF